MTLDIKINEYFSPVIVEKGQKLYHSKGISIISCVPCEDDAWLIKGKAIDSFNFVNRPWLKADSFGQNLLGYGCDCSESRNNAGMCEHCAALCFLAMDGAPAAQEVPVPKPVVKAEPVQIPVAQEVSVNESEVTFEEPAVEESAEAAEPVAKEIRSMEILLGQDDDGNPVLWYPNDTEQVFHTNVGILGTMGTGKTQFAKSLLTQLYQQQCNNYDGQPLGILIFDYKGDYNETKEDFVKATKARVLKPYRLPYNPLALHQGATFKPLLPLHTANEFKDTIAQIYGLGPKQQHLLLECITKAYRKQGIDPEKPSTWNRVAPTVDQVYKIFTEETVDKPADKLTTAMEKLHQFCIFENRPECAVSLDTLLNGVVVIDMAGYGSDIQSMIVAITLNQFYARMQVQGSSRTDGKYRQMRKFIMVDEADTFMREDFPSLRRIMKEGREFGVGMILSTQSLEHYIGDDDNYSRYILTWIVHNVGDLKQRDVEYLFKLPPRSPSIATLYATVKDLQKHHSVVKLGNDIPFRMHNKPFYELYKQMQL